MNLNQTVLKLNLPSSFKYLSVISNAIAEVLQNEPNINELEQMVYGVQLAAQEVCANIIMHGYQGNEDQRITVTIAVEQDPYCIVLEILDQGLPFDLTESPEADLDSPHVHGYGIHIVKSIMDSVVYEVRSDGNILRLIKNL